MRKINLLFAQIQKGITLLEMMLVITIIATILILATRYYESAHSSSLENVATESMQAIYSAEQQYCMDNDCTISKPSINILVTNGLLPSNFAANANPWGVISDAASTFNNPFVATFSDVPGESCTNLQSKMSATYGATGDIRVVSPCPATGTTGNMTINFY
jgi:prepilin-type N-terminal cleavage/methylation domain-containing protein